MLMINMTMMTRKIIIQVNEVNMRKDVKTITAAKNGRRRRKDRKKDEKIEDMTKKSRR